jgi:DNA-binding NarL/FixJ family response regulator
VGQQHRDDRERYGERALQLSGERTAEMTIESTSREVLQRVALGESNAEIGAALYISPATARTYVSRLLGKLGARDRAQLVVIAYESGLAAPGG